MYYVGPRDALMRLADDAGIERACLVDFICREYGRTLVREYHYGWIGEKYADGSVQIAPTPTHYIQQQIDRPWYPPTAKPGGRFRDMGDYHWFTVYFDELVLHRATGEFEIRDCHESPSAFFRTDERVRELIERRRHVPEFYME